VVNKFVFCLVALTVVVMLELFMLRGEKVTEKEKEDILEVI